MNSGLVILLLTDEEATELRDDLDRLLSKKVNLPNQRL